MGAFQISSLLLTITSFLLGFLVYVRGQKSELSRAWLLLSIFISAWGGSLFAVTYFGEGIATKFQYILDASAFLIPIAYLFFISTFLKSQQSKTFLITISTTAFILVAFSFFPLFRLGVAQKFGFFWVVPGEYYFVLPSFFLLIVFYALYLLVSAYIKNRKNTELRSQIKYQIIAGLIGFIGGSTNFLPQVFDVFPFGNYFVIFYAFIISYSILKYNLFNLKLILVELAILLFNALLLANIFFSTSSAILWVNTALFFSILIFSTMLFRNIHKDIRDRERIGGLVKEMELANDRLRVMEQSKTEFVSIASHQLRTPLTVIKGYASMILEGTFGELNDTARAAVKNLYESSGKIVALVEDLLTVSRLEQGRLTLTFKTVNYVDFIRGILAEEEGAIKEAGLNLSLSFDDTKEFWVSVDEKKFKQVVKHLLDNAVKYTPAPGSVHLDIVTSPISGKIYLAISDTGMGMAQEQINELFERFDLAASTDREKNNIHAGRPIGDSFSHKTPGIGLYIALEIIRTHGGNIRAHSAGIGKGTTFIVELPPGERPHEESEGRS